MQYLFLYILIYI